MWYLMINRCLISFFNFGSSYFPYSQIEKSVQSQGRLQDVMRIFIGLPLDLPISALIQKASFGRPMDIIWIWISCGYLMGNHRMPSGLKMLSELVYEVYKLSPHILWKIFSGETILIYDVTMFPHFD